MSTKIHKKTMISKFEIPKWWSETESHHTFNKSHAASYTLIGYQMAYLKARFPKEFTAAIKQINKQ